MSYCLLEESGLDWFLDKPTQTFEQTQVNNRMPKFSTNYGVNKENANLMNPYCLKPTVTIPEIRFDQKRNIEQFNGITESDDDSETDPEDLFRYFKKHYSTNPIFHQLVKDEVARENEIMTTRKTQSSNNNMYNILTDVLMYICIGVFLIYIFDMLVKR